MLTAVGVNSLLIALLVAEVKGGGQTSMKLKWGGP